MTRALGQMIGVGCMTVGLGVAAVGSLGCAEEEPMEIRSYVDGAGRSCSVDVHDISGTAMCDADPSALVTCDVGQDPEFVLSDDYDFETEIWTLESCTGCVDREARETYIQDCVNVTCTTDADCVRDNYDCTSGICTHL